MQKFYWQSRSQSECQDESRKNRSESKHSLASASWKFFNDKETPTQYQCRGSKDNIDKLSTYPPLSWAVNTTQHGVQVKIMDSDTSSTIPHQTTGRHRVVRMVGGQRNSRCVSVTHVTGKEDQSTPAIPTDRLGQVDNVGQKWSKKNKTWNQNTLSQAEYECGVGRERAEGERQSVQNFEFFNHSYENVYDNNNTLITAKEELQNLNITQTKNIYKSEPKHGGNTRQTPRSRKRVKLPSAVFRSKSCDRGMGTALLDLSCMSRSGRTSPDVNLACQREEQHFLKVRK